MNAPTLTLSSGHTIPRLGLGTWQLADDDRTADTIAYSLSSGYRLIDTASMYGNEAAVGRGIRESGVPRDDIFVTTKLWPSDFNDPMGSFDASFERLGLDYIDLYLVHWPQGFSQKVWRALEQLVQEGRVRDIGVSNFSIEQLEVLRSYAAILPAVNQVHCNPFIFDQPLIEYSQGAGIVIEAYRPLSRGEHLEDPTIVSIAQAHGKSPAQIMLRWSMQHDLIPLPKSGNYERLQENLAVFDFTLTKEDMKALDALA